MLTSGFPHQVSEPGGRARARPPGPEHAATCSGARSQICDSFTIVPRPVGGTISSEGIGHTQALPACKNAGEEHVATIVVAEDERDLNTLVRRHLEDDGHRVVQTYDGSEAVLAVQHEHPDLLILDWMMPKLDGLEVCRRVRRESIVPILMLTARSEEIDRVLGLEVGADDYLVKPFGIREMMARVHALLRRVELFREAGNDVPPPVLTAGALSIDLAQHTVAVAGDGVELTPKEFDLLALLVRNPGRAFARDYLLEKVWGYDYPGFDRTVDTHVLRLRKKLGASGDQIETVWGVGYRLAAHPKTAP
jgi:DNA-binding response OmpR family regulator